MATTTEILQVAKHEDLSDQLVVADAKSTPVTSAMRKGKKPTNTLYQWPVAVIPDPDTTPIPDGKPVDTTEDLSGGRIILGGRVHKVRRVAAVTEMAEDVSTPAGIDSEFRKAKANGTIAVKRAIEAVFCGTQDSLLSGSTHQCRGLGSWLQTTAQTDLPVPATYRPPTGAVYTGALVDLTEDGMRAIMQAIYQNVGQMLDLDLFAGTDLKSAISKLTITEPTVSGKTIVRTFFATLKDGGVLEGTVDIVRGDFGQFRVQPTLWNGYNNTTKLPNTKLGFILDMDTIEMCVNKLPAFKPLPEDDSGPRGVISAIVGMKLFNPLQHGMIAAT